MTETGTSRPNLRQASLTKALGIVGGVLTGLAIPYLLLILIAFRESAGSSAFLIITGLGCLLLMVAWWRARGQSASRLIDEWKVPWTVLLASGVIMVVLGLAVGTNERELKLYEVPTEAMKPAIESGDTVTAKKDAYAAGELPERGDIIVFSPTQSASRTCGDTDGDTPFIKRVIGLPGERVEVRGGLTYVDDEEFVVEGALSPDYEKLWDAVPDGHVLVLGDNRSGSCDSHQWSPNPFVPAENIIGEVIDVRSRLL